MGLSLSRLLTGMSIFTRGSLAVGTVSGNVALSIVKDACSQLSNVSQSKGKDRFLIITCIYQRHFLLIAILN